jgi:hypothetical protein
MRLLAHMAARPAVPAAPPVGAAVAAGAADDTVDRLAAWLLATTDLSGAPG